MSKPLGMTATFQIVQPDRVQDAIYEAVCEATLHGWSPERFLAEVRECWEIALDDQKKHAMEVLR